MIVLLLVSSCHSAQSPAETNGELHKMAMKVFTNPKVKTWDQLVDELEKMPDFPRDRLPPRKPGFSRQGKSARNLISGSINSGGEAALQFAFKPDRTLEEVEGCISWSLYRRRDSLSADPVTLYVFVDKEMQIVAYLQADPNR